MINPARSIAGIAVISLFTNYFLFFSHATAATPSYAETLKVTSTTGVLYELGRQTKNVTEYCGFKVAKYIWDSAVKNKSWNQISPQIQKIQKSKECQDSAQNLKTVSDEIASRNNTFLNNAADKLFPKDQSLNVVDVQVAVPENYINGVPAGGLNCQKNVSKEEILYVHSRSLLTFGQPAVIDGCDAKELYEGLSGMKEDLSDPDGYCSSMGECSHIKTLVKNKLKLKCRIMTLVTHEDKPSVYDCVAYDINNNGQRIKSVPDFASALSTFGIVIGE